MRMAKLLEMAVLMGGLLASQAAWAAEQSERYAQHFELPTGEVVVVAEGDFEPRSIGSYSVRLYSGAMPEFPFDDFLDGLVHPRDGVITSVLIEDVSGDERPDILVVIQSAGSGGDLSAHAYGVEQRALTRIASVERLDAADPVKALQDQFASSKKN